MSRRRRRSARPIALNCILTSVTPRVRHHRHDGRTPSKGAMPKQGSPEHGDVESLADALLAAMEEGAEADADADESSPDLISGAAFAFRRLGIEFVRRYNRLEVTADVGILSGPVLFVANHGFGGIFDLNVFAVGAAFEQLKLDRDVTILTHQVAWTLGVGRLI